MCTFLGTAGKINESDVSSDAVKQSEIIFLEGYLWDERFTRCFSTLLGADGGKANRTRRLMPGEIITDYKIFYLRYDEKISYNDKIIEMALDMIGIPSEELHRWNPNMLINLYAIMAEYDRRQALMQAGSMK